LTDQGETWHAGRPRPGHIVYRWGPALPPQRCTAPTNFRPISAVAKWLDGFRCHLVWRYASRGQGDFALDGDPAPLPKKGVEPPIFGPCPLWLNGWMDHNGIWHGVGPWSRPHYARWGPSSPPPKKKGWGAQPPIFSVHVYCGQTAVCIRIPLGKEVNLGPGDVALDGVAALTLPSKRGTAPSFRPMSIVAKRLDG